MQCIVCGKRAYSEYCMQHKPRKAIKTYKLPAKIGKQGRHTANAVEAWKRKQKPNIRGNYVCYICFKEVPYLMAEHVMSKARHPELRTDHNNLQPVCAECNEAKGSNDGVIIDLLT